MCWLRFDPHVPSKTMCTEHKGEIVAEKEIKLVLLEERGTLVGRQKQQISSMLMKTQTYLWKSFKLLPCLSSILKFPLGISEVDSMAPVLA